jgi:coenzyme F420 biosynthesis associated uncharacterized protein
MLVAPNVVHVERELSVNATDFRLWVCLHEETHRVQFTAVPWLADHLRGLLTQLVESFEPQALSESLSRLAEVVRTGGRPGGRTGGRTGVGTGGSAGILDAIRTPEQAELMDHVTGVMSLLEGHADVVMDGVGPEVIPSVKQIRAAFNERRKGSGPIDKLVRRLLGLDAKMAQYRDGAEFVRGVLSKVEMTDFNHVWAAPENLPTKPEIADPDAWIARVLG